MQLHRDLNITNYLATKKSFFLFGARGVGKSQLIATNLEELPKSTVVVEINLLKSDEYLRFLKSPSSFRSEVESALSQLLPRTKDPLLVFVDEIQKLPILLDEVHYLLEKYPARIQFILTGSSARKLKKTGANLLAGRAFQSRLFPLTASEIPKFNLERALQFGTLPSAYLNPRLAVDYLRSYTETYIKEEIVQEAAVRNLEPFSRFLDLSGQFDGVNITFSKWARQLDLSTKTLQNYFEILEDTLVATRIPFWSYSLINQLIQAPKFYFFDTGVLNALSGDLKSELKPGTYRYGKLFENLVVNNLIRENSYSGADNRFFNFRTTTGDELDLIVSRGPNDTPRAVEIKSKVTPNSEDLKKLAKLSAENKNFKSYCLCQTPRAYSVGKIKVLPWHSGIKEVLDGDK